MSDERPPYQYHLLYQLEPKPEGFTKAEVPSGFGATDAMILLSCLYPPDGSFSLQIMSLDGRTRAPVSDMELFKVWSMMAKRLSASETLEGSRKEFARQVFAQMVQAITGRES